jgi:hypothetical protein
VAALRHPVVKRRTRCRARTRGDEQARLRGTVGPFLRKGSGFAEHDRHRGEPHLGFGETGGDDRGSNTIQLEHRRPAIFDDDCSPWQSGEVGKPVAKFAGGQRRDQVCETLALDGCDDRSLDSNGIVTCGQRLPSGGCLLLLEAPCVPLVRVDDDVQYSAVGSRRGIDTPGRACLAVRALCQKITSRPRARANTNCERCSRDRSSTRSIAAPRCTHERAR